MKIANADVMFICHDDNRGFTWGDLKYAPLTDTIKDRLDRLNVSTISINAPYSDERQNVYGNPCNINGLMARAELLSKFKSVIWSKQRFRGAVINAWSIVLDRISPIVVIGIQPSIELCIAAKEKGIWIADLQHGVIDGEGYYGIDARSDFDQKGWPSTILCWDKKSAEWLNIHVGNLVDTVIIGNPWVARFINKRKEDMLVEYVVQLYANPHYDRPKILVSLQWGDLYHRHKPTGVPIELLKIIKNKELNYDWFIRVHPVLMNDLGVANIYKEFESEFASMNNVSWVRPTELPLPIILDQIDLHITFTSSVTIEASWFGVRTGLLAVSPDEQQQWFDAEISGGYADVIELEQVCIQSWIECNIATKKRMKNKINFASFDSFIDDVSTMVLSGSA